MFGFGGDSDVERNEDPRVAGEGVYRWDTQNSIARLEREGEILYHSSMKDAAFEAYTAFKAHTYVHWGNDKGLKGYFGSGRSW